VKFRRSLELLRLQVLQKKFWAHFHDLCIKNEAVYCEVQPNFGSSLRARFTEKVLGAITRFMRPKTKLFSVKFRRMLEVLCVQGLQKKFWAQFYDSSKIAVFKI